MPFYYPENNAPRGGDNEVRSLQKINSLFVQWCALEGLTPKLNYLGGVNPAPDDAETLSLQKINACAKALSRT